MSDVLKSSTACALNIFVDRATVKHVSPHFHAYKKGLVRLERAIERGDNRLARHLCGRLFQSYAAKISAIVRTTSMPRSAAERVTSAQLEARATELCQDSAAQERVRVWMQEKLGGGMRTICKFGWRRKAYQLIVADILDASLPVFNFDYMHKGLGGVDEMVRRIKERLEREPFQYVVTADIRNCFGSVRKERVPELLPLIPDQVVSKILLINEEVPLQLLPIDAEREDEIADSSSPRSIFLSSDAAARQGIPQGASTSGLIMRRAILGPLLAATPFADRVFLLGDDIAVLAGDRAEADAIDQALRSLLGNTVVGPLAIGRHGNQHADGWINLPKYSLKRRPRRYGGRYRVIPSQRCYENMERQFTKKAGEEGYDKADEYIDRWPGAFKLWEANETSMLYIRCWTVQMFCSPPAPASTSDKPRSP